MCSGTQLTFVEFNQSLLGCKENAMIIIQYICTSIYYEMLKKKQLNFWQLQSSTTQIITEKISKKEIGYHKNACILLFKRRQLSPLGQGRA